MQNNRQVLKTRNDSRRHHLSWKEAVASSVSSKSPPAERVRITFQKQFNDSAHSDTDSPTVVIITGDFFHKQGRLRCVIEASKITIVESDITLSHWPTSMGRDLFKMLK